MTRRKPFLLAILDGLALNPSSSGNAFNAANTPTLDALLSKQPHTTLITYGPRVGLPEGQMGNSEVGHLNIGAGRVVMQDLTRINLVSELEEFNALQPFKNLCEKVTKSDNSALHLIGLVSTGGVHSEISHLQSLLNALAKSEVRNVFVHAITDGRDRPPTDSIKEIDPLLKQLELINLQNPDKNFQVASVIGRYYAMDRDKRWERVEKAYKLFYGEAQHCAPSVKGALESSHLAGITDEFIEPYSIECGTNSKRPSSIIDGDGVLFFNFRADRMREIVMALCDEDFTEFERKNSPVKNVLTFTEYDETFNLPVLFGTESIQNHLGEVLSQNNLTQLRIAETEKYPHVTYFFSGGDERILPGEERILVQSPKDVATYDLKPEMSAVELTGKLLERLSKAPLDVIILNFANCDMVGHTGVFEAAVKAIETVDTCLGQILEVILSLGGMALVTADHGNADQMIDYKTGGPHTFHTLHPVPLILVGGGKNLGLKQGGSLCDIAPTILELLEIEQPKEMTASSLLIKS